MDVLTPTPSLLSKLGSIMAHAEELVSPEGHTFDRLALEDVLRDPEVIEWRRAADAMGLIPVARS